MAVTGWYLSQSLKETRADHKDGKLKEENKNKHPILLDMFDYVENSIERGYWGCGWLVKKIKNRLRKHYAWKKF